MHFHTGLLTAASVFLSVFAVQIATAEPSDPPYQEKLERLSEIIGSVHFLRNLCGETSNIWRDKMDQLLEAENPASDPNTLPRNPTQTAARRSSSPRSTIRHRRTAIAARRIREVAPPDDPPDVDKRLVRVDTAVRGERL